MKEKPYTAKSLAGAQRRVRELDKLVNKITQLLEKYAETRRLMAKLAADGPAFDNPLHAAAAKDLRDTILREECRLNPDGTPVGSKT